MANKMILIGDTHIGLGYPNKTEKWLNVHREYFDEFLIPKLEEIVEEGDIIVHLGDLFDNRNVIPINLLNFAMDQVERISKIAPLHIIVGNHDCWSRSTDEINTIRPFKYIPNVSIYDKVSVLDYNGLKFLLMPYYEKKSEQIKHLNENKHCDYVLCHSDLNGAKMHLTSTGHKNHDMIGVDEFKGFKGVYSGHIHLVQRQKNFTFIGSNFQMDRNDYGDQKGIFVINTDDESEEFIENNVSPIFRKVRIVEEEDLEKLEDLKHTKDYVDIMISNNLLINNRKLRRKLEILLEEGKFASVDYIDDITNDLEDEEEDEKLNEEFSEDDLDISIQLDYEDYIKEYIKKQSYDNKKFKSGILSEYDDIIEIYKENYKLNKNNND
jgi:calcineurin-like phosphoesterase family protein